MFDPGDIDGEVIASSRRRPELFEVVFDRHAASVHRYLRRRVGESLAEELTAETFARALRARGQFDIRRASALPWLYGIAANLIKMHVRSEQRRQRAYRLVASTPVQLTSTVESDARLDAQALGPALNAALAVLPPNHREVLLLNAWAELSPTEIAEALSIPSALVRKRLHRARAQAAEALRRLDRDATYSTAEPRTAQ